MACISFSPHELFGMARRLARVLMNNPHVLEVRMTGSLARVESHIHDIDLVVLHDGNLINGTISSPKDCSYCGEPGHKHIKLSYLLGLWHQLLFNLIKLTVPVQIIIIDHRALYDCNYLQALKDWDSNPEFWKSIFTELDMIPIYQRTPLFGLVLNYLFREHEQMVEDPVSQSNIRLLYPHTRFIAHECDDQRCKPMISWNLRRNQRPMEGIRKSCTFRY